MYKFLFLIIFSGWASNSNCQQTKFSFTREKMGSPFTIILYDADSTHATTTVENSFKLVDSLVNIFSDYINESELNRLSNSSGLNKNVTVSKDLYDIMVQSEKAFKMSNGAFDITVGPLTRLWRKARKEKVFPDDSAVINSKRKTGFNKIRIDHTNRKVQLSDPGMRLDLGGIAQGFIGQKVLDQLAQSSIKNALINVSGD
ncbi:MAG TPA: FAD:protein FMN transferase, partial [Segetibacter sp.]